MKIFQVLRLVPGIEDASRGNGRGESPFKRSLFAMHISAQGPLRVRR